MDGALVFDIGMNDGTDSAYYLRRGYSVVGVEANPVLAEEAKGRFSKEIEEDRFAVVNVGIAEREGEAEFWVCDDWSPWSSFDRSIAGRNGKRHHAERVELRTMDKLVGEFGIPYYCKVDIEGHDQYCLDGLSVDAHPRFMSVELSEYPFLDHMHRLGYERFKFIHQLSFSPLSERWFALRSHVPNEKIRAGLERFRGVVRRSLSDGRWYFKIGSSGPMPEDTPGPWLTYEEALRVREQIDSRYKDGSFGLLDCFDLHATGAG